MAATATAPSGLSGATGIRQSNRQTRTNPSRVSKNAGRSSLGTGGPQSASAMSAAAGGAGPTSSQSYHQIMSPQGVYPGITNFTDTIAAIPREFRRHESLLKEVDGKSWALEDKLPPLVSEAAEKVMIPARMGVRPGEEETHPVKRAGLQSEPPETVSRRQLFREIRGTLSDLLPTMDEKNHVARNANKDLKKQMQRLDNAYSFAKSEVSDESRLGNLNHWAYSNKAIAKAAATGTERTRRETAHAREQNAAAGDDARRDAVGTRKQRRTHIEQDVEDGRVRKVTAGTKGKADDQGTMAAAKRRKVEKSQAAPTSAPMARSASTNTTTGRSGAGKDAGATDKRKNRAPNATTTAQRKRTNTATSAAGSPSIPPSPLVSAVGVSGKAASPALNASNRPQSTRGPAPSTQSANNGRQRPPSSTSGRAPKKTTSDPKGSHKDQSGPKSGLSSAGLNGDNKPGSSLASVKSLDSLNREDSAGRDNVKPEGFQTSHAVPAGNSKGRSSKTSTPASSTFPESQQTQQARSRPLRSTEGGAPAKRSHKKGAGSISTARQVAAAAAAAAAAAEDEDSSRQGDDEDDEHEPRYCYCNQVSFGEMVACDNDHCPREWFHLSCVGMTKPPLKSAKWYCNECKEGMKKSKSGNGR